ncbi:hypothetical protein JTB14_037302 [Gonioctena quinquepunctata]|nr:hypothetical protein JTB14_037302 [Gonioctena quinquepunctata]
MDWTKIQFSVSNLKFMELMFDVVHKKSSITKKEFEFYVKEWFRHSKQKRERRQKKGKMRPSINIYYSFYI